MLFMQVTEVGAELSSRSSYYHPLDFYLNSMHRMNLPTEA